MIDLQTALGAYQALEVNVVAYIRSEYNVADAWTKVKDFSALV